MSKASVWCDQMNAFQHDSGGAADIYIITPSDMAGIVFLAAAGEPKAVMLVGMSNDTLAQIAGAPEDDRKQCACCREPLGILCALVFVIPVGRHDKLTLWRHEEVTPFNTGRRLD